MPESPYPIAPTVERPGFRTTRQDLADGLDDAGWNDGERVNVGAGTFLSLSWGNLRTLWAARAEKLHRLYRFQPDAVMREAWMATTGPRGNRTASAADPVVLKSAEQDKATRVLVLGDTGDGSQAQRAVAVQLLGRAGRPGASGSVDVGAAAILLSSDIVYPAGAASEQRQKFFRPYRDILETSGIPIYAVPGNHDWDDGRLAGFMRTFCGAGEVPPEVRSALVTNRRGWPLRSLAALLTPREPGPSVVDEPPPSGNGSGQQTTPYFALDIDGVLFIGIDTGYDGMIDIGQAAWLVSMVEHHAEMPKVLFTGKPLIVNGVRKPCRFAPLPSDQRRSIPSSSDRKVVYCSVDDVVRRPENLFVAAGGGDVHNYQRYVADITREGRRHVLPYFVCGGGGVFIGQTYWLADVAIDGATRPEADDPEGAADHVRCREAESVLFPGRAHSRLFIDALMRRAISGVRFVVPIALTVAAAMTLLLATISLFVHQTVQTPDALSAVAILLVGVAVNISARPNTARGALAAMVAASVAVGLVWLADIHGLWGLSAHLTGIAISVGVLAGVAAALVGDWTSRRHRIRMGGGVAALVIVLVTAMAIIVATNHQTPQAWLDIAAIYAVIAALGLAIAWLTADPGASGSNRAAIYVGVAAAVCATVWVVEWVAANHTTWGWIVPLALIPLVAGTVLLYLTGRLTSRPTVDDWTNAPAVVTALARRQRLFSIYETFNDGRLNDTATVRYADRQAKVKMPLYRSLVEIEYQKTGDSSWRFEFTAFAVTGEANSDTDPAADAPVVIDAFTASLDNGELAFTPRAGDAPDGSASSLTDPGT